jgi:hypothetical protein
MGYYTLFFAYSTVPFKMLCSCFSVVDRDVCQVVENPLLLRTTKEEVGVQVVIVKAIGQDLTPTQRRKFTFCPYKMLTC